MNIVDLLPSEKKRKRGAPKSCAIESLTTGNKGRFQDDWTFVEELLELEMSQNQWQVEGNVTSARHAQTMVEDVNCGMTGPHGVFLALPLPFFYPAFCTARQGA